MNLVGPFPPNALGGLSPSEAVEVLRQLLLCEARYAGMRPDAVTISQELFVADGGIDADVSWDRDIPQDCLLSRGCNGIQLKTGTSFKPWQSAHLGRSLLSKSGELVPEVKRTLEAGGRYVLVCLGTDFTPQQRAASKSGLVELLARHGFVDLCDRVDILGQGQIASYVDRYPPLRMSILGVSDDGFLSVAQWSQHAHMANQMAFSESQQQLVEQIRSELRGDATHIRVLGEAGIGKSRLVLEAVRIPDLAALTLYFPNGERFGQTALFRDLLRASSFFPMVLVVDELPEREMTEVWGHLKQRPGKLKLVTIDHGPTRSRDADMVVLSAPRLDDTTIRAILVGHVGTAADLDRWVDVCEGSPRVAQAVGANLAANPKDILCPPATIPFWDRFIFGYAKHDSAEARQCATVLQHISLFSRFGFEAPVSDEAEYIAAWVLRADPSITWPRFQAIVQSLRDRRIIQGVRTLFIVPWALHIYLWRQHWKLYARGFDFGKTLDGMPASLQGWFLEMFRYAHDSNAERVVKDILRPDGAFADREFLLSRKGASFLGALTEADPASSLTLLEQTLGTWTHDELLAIKETRQEFVWILEKIAVWRPLLLRSMALLIRLALAENAENVNNATGTLLGLFRIGPEWAATEASPAERLPVLREMLRSSHVETCRLGLRVARSANNLHPGMRIVGAECQGLKERAKLWCPQTYGDWQEDLERYWRCLIEETRCWPDAMRAEANEAVLSTLEGILQIVQLQESAFDVLDDLAADRCTDARALNRFLSEQSTRYRRLGAEGVAWRLRRLAGRLARKNLRSRFQRYVLDTTWREWDIDAGDESERRGSKARQLVRALAKRVVLDPVAFEELLPTLVSTSSDTGALFHFGGDLAEFDLYQELLSRLLRHPSEQRSTQCLGGYLAAVKKRNADCWRGLLLQLLSVKADARLGADLVCRTGFDVEVFGAWVEAYERGWIDAQSFHILGYGRLWKEVPEARMRTLLERLAQRADKPSANLLMDLLHQVTEEENWIVEKSLVVVAASASVKLSRSGRDMEGYRWCRVCERLIERDADASHPLLEILLLSMGDHFHLGYDQDVDHIARRLCLARPMESWDVIRVHLLRTAPQWRGDLLHWLKGGIRGFDEMFRRPPIADLPLQEILKWIEQDRPTRASMIAHASPASLDDEHGGELTRALIDRYGSERGVLSGIGANFHSGGWSGPESKYLRGKRDQMRTWLSQGFSPSVCRWIENEIIYLDQRIEACEIYEERRSWDRSPP